MKLPNFNETVKLRPLLREEKEFRKGQEKIKGRYQGQEL